MEQLEIDKAITQQSAYRIKQSVKNILKKIDEQGTGLVNIEAFQLLLKSNGVILSEKSFNLLVKLVGSNGNKLNFAKALKYIQPNLDVDEPLMKEWLVGAGVRGLGS